MKIGDISKSIIDLSDKPPLSVITKLRKNDVVQYDGSEWQIEFPPKKIQKGIWWVGIKNDFSNKYVRVLENTKPRMTAHEKRTMIKNVKSISQQFKDNETRLIDLVQRYYYNLANHNNYDQKDVRDVIGKFPLEAVKKSGVVI